MSNFFNNNNNNGNNNNNNNNKKNSNDNNNGSMQHAMNDTDLMANPWENSMMSSSNFPSSNVNNVNDNISNNNNSSSLLNSGFSSMFSPHSVASHSMSNIQRSGFNSNIYRSQSDPPSSYNDLEMPRCEESGVHKAIHQGPTQTMSMFGGAVEENNIDLPSYNINNNNDFNKMGGFGGFGMNAFSRERNNVPKRQNSMDHIAMMQEELPNQFKQMGFSIPAPKVLVMKDNDNNNDDSKDNFDDDDFDMTKIFVPPKLRFSNNTDSVESSSMSNNNTDEFISQTIRKDDGCFVKPKFYNEFTTCIMENEPKEVLTILEKILNEYNSNLREIEITNVNLNDFTIEGIVYIKHKPIKFNISIWHESEQNDTLTRVEFQKRRGDSIIFQQFWSEMLELMVTNLRNVRGADRCTDFESLFLPAFTLEDDYIYTNNDLDNMVMDLKEDYRDEGLDILATICDEMNNNKFSTLVSKHNDLLNVLIEDTLTHFDACHIRGGLYAISKMIELEETCIENLVSKSQIMKSLPKLLDNSSKIVQRRTIEVMSQLSVASNNWNLCDKDSVSVEAAMVQFATDFGNDNKMQEMLGNIKNKVDCDRSITV